MLKINYTYLQKILLLRNAVRHTRFWVRTRRPERDTEVLAMILSEWRGYAGSERTL